MDSNAFLSTLQRHSGGVALSEASQTLAEVVAAVLETGKPGTVALIVKVEKASRGNNAVVITHEVKAKAPEAKEAGSFWFASPDGTLSRTDPNQEEMRFTPQVSDGGSKTESAKPEAKQAVNQ